VAANPSDARKPADVFGTRYDDLKTNAKAAVEACVLAMGVYPAEIRYRYQYARALEIDEPQKAIELHTQLVHDGYLASYDNAGSLLISAYKNIPEAIKYFKEGARRGDPDSMVSLADLIDRHYVPENDPVAARFVLLSRAAQLGHPGAQLAVERERIKFQQVQQQREFQQQQGQLMMQMFGTVLQRLAH
jgi:TPR repeat protein